MYTTIGQAALHTLTLFSPTTDRYVAVLAYALTDEDVFPSSYKLYGAVTGQLRHYWCRN